jgi:hypothetical protein
LPLTAFGQAAKTTLFDQNKAKFLRAFNNTAMLQKYKEI